MAKWAQGFYTPKNPQKYIGKHRPRYRSSWELAMMVFLDNNDNILHWASESMKIPYRHPFTGKPTNYIPDFFVVYKNKHGKTLAEIVEIKPKKGKKGKATIIKSTPIKTGKQSLTIEL